MHSCCRWRCMLRPITVPSARSSPRQRGRAVALVVIGHGSGATLLQRQTSSCSIQRLDLSLFIDAEHDGVRRQIDLSPTISRHLSTNLLSFDSLLCQSRCGRSPWRARCAARTDAEPISSAIAAPVLLGLVRGFSPSARPLAPRCPYRASLCAQPLLSAEAHRRLHQNRSCQHHTPVFDLPVSLIIAFVPTPLPLSITSTPQTCFCVASVFTHAADPSTAFRAQRPAPPPPIQPDPIAHVRFETFGATSPVPRVPVRWINDAVPPIST